MHDVTNNYIYRYAFFSASQDRGVHPSSFRPGVRDVTMFYLRRLGRRLHLMNRLLCRWNRLLCSKAFLQWRATSQGYSRACVYLLGFMFALIFVFGCRVCVCGRVTCIGMQNGGSIRALVRSFVSVSVCVYAYRFCLVDGYGIKFATERSHSRQNQLNVDWYFSCTSSRI